MRQPAAFTLVETMLAVLLMALLASAVALSFSKPLQAARAREAISQVQFADSQARQLARQSSRAIRLVLDPELNTIARFEGEQREAQATLPVGIRIAEVVIGRHASFDERAEVQFSASGLSRSYAIHLIGPSLDQWVLFAGLSGQMSWAADEQTVRSILEVESPPGRDAD
jgi:type II secretory pathway pseudopilin PulG